MKHEKSKKHKSRDQQKAEEEKEKKQQKADEKKQQQEFARRHVKHARNPHKCKHCERRFPTVQGLNAHACQESETVSEPVVDLLVAYTGPELAPYDPADENCEFTEVIMGHGLVDGREQNPLDAVVTEILERLFQAGVVQSSNRKGVLEMLEALQKELPALLVPEIHQISSWLQSRLAASTGDSGTKAIAKTDFERKQEKAAILPKSLKDLVGVNSELAKQKFEFHYRGAVLEVGQDERDPESETEIRIVTAVKFVDGLGWHIVADHACETEQNMHSVEKYFAPAGLGNARELLIKSGNTKYPGLGTHIKRFNKNYLMPEITDYLT